MAKKKNHDAFAQMIESGPPSESVTDAANSTIAIDEPQQSAISIPKQDSGAEVLAAKTPRDESVLLVEIPICDERPPSEFQIHIDLTLKPPLATILRRIASQLDRQGATLNSGKRVVQANTAFIWMMERLLESSKTS